MPVGGEGVSDDDLDQQQGASNDAAADSDDGNEFYNNYASLMNEDQPMPMPPPPPPPPPPPNPTLPTPVGLPVTWAAGVAFVEKFGQNATAESLESLLAPGEALKVNSSMVVYFLIDAPTECIYPSPSRLSQFTTRCLRATTAEWAQLVAAVAAAAAAAVAAAAAAEAAVAEAAEAAAAVAVV